MIQPTEKPVVSITGLNGNAFSIMGKVQYALKKNGADREYIDQYLSEAMSGDYDHLLAVSLRYVMFEG
jgi:hypothetical protein